MVYAQMPSRPQNCLALSIAIFRHLTAIIRQMVAGRKATGLNSLVLVRGYRGAFAQLVSTRLAGPEPPSPPGASLLTPNCTFITQTNRPALERPARQGTSSGCVIQNKPR